MNKIINPCTCEVYDGKQVQAYIKIKYKDNRLSLCGVVGPMTNGNCKGSAGQCTDEIRKGTPTEQWTSEMLVKLCDIWDKWHLNDMHPECEHQRELGWREQACEIIDQYHWVLSDKKLSVIKDRLVSDILEGCTPALSEEERVALKAPKWVVTASEDPPEPKKFYDKSYKFHEQVRRGNAWYQRNTLGENDPRGILCKPCPVCGYKYGNSWIHEDVPADVIEWLFALPDTERGPAWV